MVQPIQPYPDAKCRIRPVTPEALAAAYQALYPSEVASITSHVALAREWISEIGADPVGTVGAVGKFWKPTLAFFKALDLPAPNTEAMALFILTNPDLEKQATELVFISAKTPDDESLDLVVRAVSREHAEIVWRDYFDGWDMPDRPYTITPIPVAGPPGAIRWDVIAPSAEEPDDQDEDVESPAP